VSIEWGETMNIVRAIEYLYPKAKVLKDFVVADNGKGQYIAEWHLPVPKPSEKNLRALENDPGFRTWLKNRQGAKIDHNTGKAINGAIHPFVGVEEQIGILRDQLVHVLNALGIEPTPEFARLNEIAIKEIEAAREKKEALNAQDDSA